MGIIRHFILSILANSAAIFGVSYFFTDDFKVTGGFQAFLIIGFLLGFLNTTVKPILKLVSLPFLIITMGIFLIAINMGILWILTWIFDNWLDFLNVSLEITGNWTSFFLASLTLGIFNSITHWLIK